MINMNGITLVLDVESDTLHRVDDVAGEVIALLNEEVAPPENIKNILKEKYPPQELTEALNEAEFLRKEGVLWAKPFTEG